MNDVRLYTKGEAQQILLFESHQEFGHDWEEIRVGGSLFKLTCECGAVATVTNPTLPYGRTPA